MRELSAGFSSFFFGSDDGHNEPLLWRSLATGGYVSQGERDRVESASFAYVNTTPARAQSCQHLFTHHQSIIYSIFHESESTQQEYIYSSLLFFGPFSTHLRPHCGAFNGDKYKKFC